MEREGEKMSIRANEEEEKKRKNLTCSLALSLFFFSTTTFTTKSSSILTGEPIASERFTVGGHEWVLLFYPDGKRSSSAPAQEAAAARVGVGARGRGAHEKGPARLHADARVGRHERLPTRAAARGARVMMGGRGQA